MNQPEDPKPSTPPQKDEAVREEIKKRSETAVLSPHSRLRRPHEGGESNGTSTLGADTKEVFSLIRGMIERLLLAENVTVVLGRTDLSTRYHPDVDLTPYGALDRGVSRSHAKLHMQGRKLYVTDLDSTNGTFVAGKRLDPNKPELLRKGEELLLGRLGIQVLF